MKAASCGRRRARALLVGVACLALPAIGSAQTSIHAVGHASANYTDNLLGAPEKTVPGAAPRVNTVYFALTPGLELYSDHERSRFLLSYAHTFTFYVGYPELNAPQDNVQGRGVWSLSEADELLLNLSASRMTTAAALTSTPTAPTSAQGDGRSQLFRFDAGEQLTHALDEHWRAEELANVGVTAPISTPVPQPTRYNALGGLGLDYAFERNAVGARASASYFLMGNLPAMSAGLGPRRQLIVDVLGRVRRDLTEFWTTELRAGAAFSFNLEGDSFKTPRWGGTLFWRREGFGASLAYDRTVTASLITGYTYLSDSAQLAVQLPLIPRAYISAQAGTGLSRNRIIGANGSLIASPMYLWATNAMVGYFPEGDLPSVYLTYQHFEQKNEDEATAIAPAFARNTVSLFVSGRFPARRIGEIPVQAPQRVDGGDRSGVGSRSGGGTDDATPSEPSPSTPSSE